MTAKAIVEAVCLEFEVDEDSVMGESQLREHCDARQVCYALLHRQYGWSQPRIANFFGRKDHSTVSKGLDSYDRRVDASATLDSRVTRLRFALGMERGLPIFKSVRA